MSNVGERTAAEVFLHDLAESIDPLAFSSPDEHERFVRCRDVYARVRVALDEWSSKVRRMKDEKSFEQWAKGAAMTNDLETSMPQGVDPLVVLTLELAAMLRPDICSELSAESYRQELLTREQYYTVAKAMEFVHKTCLWAEREYAVYLFRDKASVA